MIGGEQHMKSETLAAKAVEKTLRGKVQKQTFPSRLEIPQKRGIPTFHTASTAAGHSFLSGLTGSDPNRRNWLPLSPALTTEVVAWPSIVPGKEPVTIFYDWCRGDR